ncbi:HAD superfamily hydrolase (TIGR01459 family) [Hasllibacter halocynthiae]|uniref:HAD superfamily hydrolase (TIGR01459 family) n=1 Tax=Hasllibacter halocynthiae TaxID=595589 RepID=A0A2T0X2D0_9RHOB|nr:TIGR01459 family HAD-type hydrolase [Hasllibacter halocynthiae]PRY93100.1 HAD superfamily hydrolase (TIGR01459 family) [Hasllibacter halocynthiae]
MRLIASLAEVAARYDAVVLDQWGVLHDGAAPYPSAPWAMRALAGPTRLAVLSNSGKRAAVNRARIRDLGLPDLAEVVMTSGEALWRDLAEGRIPARRPYPVADRRENADIWAKGLDLVLAHAPGEADAILVMGLDEARVDEARAAIAEGVRRGLPILCSNPDRGSPRTGGRTALAPGTLAAEAEAAGAAVTWYGKPYRPVFEATRRALDLPSGARLLMVGDSPAHDVAGAKGAGWDAALIAGGLHAARLSGRGVRAARTLCAEEGAPEPDYLLEALA